MRRLAATLAATGTLLAGGAAVAAAGPAPDWAAGSQRGLAAICAKQGGHLEHFPGIVITCEDVTTDLIGPATRGADAICSHPLKGFFEVIDPYTWRCSTPTA